MSTPNFKRSLSIGKRDVLAVACDGAWELCEAKDASILT
jgi:hypothetical protein